MVKRGNLSKDQTTYAWKEQGIRKSHKLGKKDLLISMSLTEDFMIRQKGKPSQFMLLDYAALSRYLKKKADKGINLYLSQDAFNLLESELSKILHMDNVHVVHPAYTHTKKAQAASSSHDSNQADETNQADEPNQADDSNQADEANQADEENEDSHAASQDEPPIGLYKWVAKNNTSLQGILCSNDTRSKFLRQESAPSCNAIEFDRLSSNLSCEAGMTVKKCVRNLLKHLHPDKLASEDARCGEEMYKQLSQIKNELDTRDFDYDQQC